MPEVIVKIAGRDPLLFRDGRPFTNELGALFARTLRVPAAETLAGFLRTQTGSLLGWAWDAESAARAQALWVAGPLLMRDECVVFPAPADGLVVRAGGGGEPRLVPLRPYRPPRGAGCDLPPGVLPLRVSEETKPETDYRYWTIDTVLAWLESRTGEGVPAPDRIPGLDVEERTHVAIEDESSTSKDQHLFTTQGLVFGATDRRDGFFYYEWSIVARVRGEDARPLFGLRPFGGESRMAYLETLAPDSWPVAPQTLTDLLEGAGHVRMLLATPGLFARGWRPGWLGDDMQGAPPGAQGVRLRLVAAAIPRREAVSGWDYRERKPKPVRWLVPAGAVYFFRVVEGNAAELAREAWLEPVSDGEQARRDGYGLALWGIWEPEESV